MKVISIDKTEWANGIEKTKSIYRLFGPGQGKYLAQLHAPGSG